MMQPACPILGTDCIVHRAGGQGWYGVVDKIPRLVDVMTQVESSLGTIELPTREEAK